MIPPPRASSRAFSLVEVVLALGIATFCLVAIFGLLPVGVNNDQISLMQTAAASAASGVAADVRAAPKATDAVPAPVSPLFALPIPASGDAPTRHTVFLREDGSIAAASGTNVDVGADPSQNPAFRATVFCYPPAKDAKQRGATTARILITWPALADPAPATAPTNHTGAFEAVVTLDQN